MGLDDFKQEKKTRTRSKDKTSEKWVIHMAPGVDIGDVKIPARIKQHEVDKITFSAPGDEEVSMITCMDCNVNATSYEAIVKSEHLKFQDALWYEKFKEQALDSDIDFKGGFSASVSESGDGVLTDMDTEDDEEEQEDSGGIMSFKS